LKSQDSSLRRTSISGKLASYLTHLVAKWPSISPLVDDIFQEYFRSTSTRQTCSKLDTFSQDTLTNYLYTQSGLEAFLVLVYSNSESGAGYSVTQKPGGRGRVWISTIHQAKGLEWPHVFVPHFNKQVYRVDAPRRTKLAIVKRGENEDDPPKWGISKEDEEEDSEGGGKEEEARLAHVAFTRAEESLHVSYIRRLRKRGGSAADSWSPSGIGGLIENVGGEGKEGDEERDGDRVYDVAHPSVRFERRGGFPIILREDK
jgi:superfamily I DNA/RNA helicase